jgi:CubicO group peptidase (beta-lactamase class C family)
VENLLQDAVRDQVFPGCVALVWADGVVRYEGAHGTLGSHPAFEAAARPVSLDTMYDLASLTKILGTTTLTAIAVAEGRLALDEAVPSEWAQGCPGATLVDLLEHCSGLVAHREYFASVVPFSATSVLAAVAATPPGYPLRQQAVYSDLGFIILGAWLQRAFETSLVEAFTRRVAEPLGLDRELYFRPLPSSSDADLDRIAPTEVYLESLHPDGVPSHFDVRKAKPYAHGEVHDDNCYVMGGVAGHAGLFGTVRAVRTVASAWLETSLPGLTAAVRDRFWTPSATPGSTRRLGFDGPSPDGSGTAGTAVSMSAVGHTGYTGTSLWIDPAAEGGPRIYVLLSNRVHPVRTNDAIRAFRPRFHEAAAKL